jgi:hypothetical protein
MWDLWWTKWRWGGSSPNTSISPTNLHSTNCFTITIIYHLGLVQYASSGRSTKWTQSRLTKNNKKKNCEEQAVWERLEAPHTTLLSPLSFPSCVRLYGHHVLRGDYVWLTVRSRVASCKYDNEPCRSTGAENFMTSKAALIFNAPWNWFHQTADCKKASFLSVSLLTR